jgi:hypothetical protein
MAHGDHENEPVSREAWQRLLRDREDAPSEATDARIRKAARRVLAPRAARWWLPASLAASVLLAVVIVQLQLGRDEAPALMTEDDLARPAVPAQEGARAVHAPRDVAPAAAPRRTDAPAEEALSDEARFAPEPDDAGLSEVTPTARSRIGGPEEDLRAAGETGAEVSYPETAITSGIRRSETERQETAEVQPPAAFAPTVQRAAVELKDPEAWYAEIEKLRAAGRVDEADRELARLERAHPGWIERHRAEAERRTKEAAPR